jgi:1-acyl-sn-glycerol-3-phosphate acyltransferase
MRIPVARNVHAASFTDAVQLALPAWRLASSRNRAKLGRAESPERRDALLRRWSRMVLAAVDARVELHGLSNMRAGQSYLVLPLHESLVDVPLLIDSLPLPMTFVARAELDEEKPIAGLLNASHQVIITPEATGSLRTVVRAAALLRLQGRSVVIFPQGSVLGIEAAFQPGACFVAEKLEMPVLPVVIAGSHRIWERPFSSLVRRHQPVYMEVLPPRHIARPAEYRALEREMKAVAFDNVRAAPRRYVPARDGIWDGYKFDIDDDFPVVATAIERDQAATGPLVTASP